MSFGSAGIIVTVNLTSLKVSIVSYVHRFVRSQHRVFHYPFIWTFLLESSDFLAKPSKQTNIKHASIFTNANIPQCLALGPIRPMTTQAQLRQTIYKAIYKKFAFIRLSNNVISILKETEKYMY